VVVEEEQPELFLIMEVGDPQEEHLALVELLQPVEEQVEEDKPTLLLDLLKELQDQVE
jgi:hypothetical protein